MRRRRSDREGYVTLLAITFAFGLATLGTTVAVASRSYIASARRAEAVLMDRMALETAVWSRLGRLAASAAGPDEPVEVQAGIEVMLSLPSEKWDPDMDGRDPIMEALGETDRLAVFLEARGGMAERSRVAGLSGGEEDCVRRQVTLGRAPQEKATAEEAAEITTIGAGDQLDVRAATPTGRVLWVRARYLGHAEGWALHDYRLLQVGAANACG